MKKLVRILILALTLSFLVPVQTYAAPTGYKVVKITKKNVKKYFGFKKFKYKDAFGDYTGYDFQFYNKLHKKKYYVYDTNNFAVKIKFKERLKDKNNGTGWRTYTKTSTRVLENTTTTLRGCYWSWMNYKYGKILSTKIKKAKGTVIFIKPSNIIGIEKMKDDDGKLSGYRIKLRYPYDKTTWYESHYDETTNKEVIDYYYITIQPDEWKYR